MSAPKMADGRFQARWRDPDGRQRTKIFTTKREAEDHLAEVRVGARKGTYVGSRPGSVTLRQFSKERFMPFIEANFRPNTGSTYRAHLHNHILPRLGGMKLAAIKRADCSMLVSHVSGKLAATTTGTVYAVLQSALKLAVEDGLLGFSPADGVKLPEVVERVLEPLAPAAVAALAGAISPRYELAVWLAAGLGLREGEVLGLTAARVDFLRRRVHVVQQLQNRRLVAPKTKKSVRTVPADDMILGKVNAHLAAFPAGPDGLINTNRYGLPVQRNAFGAAWRDAVKAAGLPAGTRFHDLRHFYASVLIGANLNPKVVQARLGHATISETMDTYAHLWPDDAEVGRGAITAVFARPVQDQLAQ